MSDMTCHEIRSYFETSGLGIDRRELEAHVGQHLQTCPKCAQELQAQVELLGILNLVRDSAPATSVSLDSVVLRNFRKRAAQTSDPKAISFFSQPIFGQSMTPLRWRGAIAAVIVLAGIALFAHRRSGPALPITVQSFPQASPQKESNPHVEASISSVNTLVPASPRPNRRSERDATQRAALAANAPKSQPADFNGLMYCDSLICSEGMEIIRMQLPAPTQSPDAATQNPVYADVIVGPDGIARGYRVVR
jgi:hypothetical protein